ncbi:MAG: hypothetical protein ACT4P4_05820 [Betaproteobacteria bacterium]
MKNLPRNRKVLLAVAGFTLAATMVMGREKPTREIIEATRTERRAEPALELDLSRLDRAAVAVAAQDGDPFAARNFNTPPVQQAQAAAAPQAPAAPDAPPLPFRYIGHMVEDGRTTLFLANGEEPITARVGEKVASQWRLDRITEHEVVLTYLPLKKKQSLPL